jgi:hypothetical protein
MKSKIINWLKWKLAKEELTELYLIKRRASEAKVWCSHIPLVAKTANYIEDPKSYEYQCFGVHGSIEDFRRYIEKDSEL